MFSSISLAVIASFLALSAAAQDLENTEAGGLALDQPYAWYTQPWVWAIVAAAVILFIFIFSSGRRKRKA